MKPLKLRMSPSPRSLTAEKQVLSGRLFLPGELHICAPPTASCSCLSARVCMCRKAGHQRNAVFLQNIDPGSLWCHAGPQGSPWQVLNTLRWQASASHLLHSSSPKSLWTLTLLVKTDDAGSPHRLLCACIRERMSEWTGTEHCIRAKLRPGTAHALQHVIGSQGHALYESAP